jgi:hypothetical protein
MGYTPKAGVFSAYLSNDSRHLGKKITKARALKYLESLEGHITCRSATKFLQEVQTLHLIIVLCPDGELTPDNWMSMLRCDCKGYWGTRCCSHNTATAAWYGNEWGLTPHDDTLIDVIHLASVIQPNAKPGRPKKRRKALETQPQSPPKKKPEAQQLLPQESTPVQEDGPDVEFTKNIKKRSNKQSNLGEALERAATEPSGADNKKGKTSGADNKQGKTSGAANKQTKQTPAPKPAKPPAKKQPETTPASKPSANNTTGAAPKPDKPPDQKKPEANVVPDVVEKEKASLKRRRRDVAAEVAVQANKVSQPKNKDYINKHVFSCRRPWKRLSWTTISIFRNHLAFRK